MRHIFLILALVLTAPALAVAQGAPPPGPSDSTMVREAAHTTAPADERAVDYLWVLRTAILDSAAVDSVVARAAAMNVRALLVQVVGRGDAYYRSDILPRAEALPAGVESFDPLARLVERTHAAGLEVHAWMNCMLVWSGRRPPRDPRHVVNAHPEWVAELRDGRRLSRLGPNERRRRGIEGVFLTAAHPAVRTWLARIAQEIASRYAVDGIHLDYIRQPSVAVGYDPNTRARFALEAGVDPDRFDRLPADRRAEVEAQWWAFQRAQVTAVVREVRDSVHAVRPAVALTAAVIADTISAERTNAQAWRSWVHDGLLDRVFPMCYAQPVQHVMDQLLAYQREFGPTDRVVPGIAVYNTSAASAATKIKGARALGYPRLALYSYDSLFERPDQWSRLLGSL